MRRAWQLLVAWWSACFTLDLRSLALFRMGLGLMVAVDAAMRAVDVTIFYTDAGVFPSDRVSWSGSPSLYLLNGSTAFALVLMALTAMCGVALMVGWRTRIATAVCWVLVLSVQNRNHYINTGADGVLISLLIIACFLPLEARFSLDARRRPERCPQADTVLGWATVALVVQIIVIYFFNVIHKNNAAWWRGEAVLTALHIDEHATVFGVFVREHLKFLSVPLTWLTLLVEASALMLLVPIAAQRIRLVLVVAFWGMHLGFAACMQLGLFAPNCMVAWLAILPALFWQHPRIAARIAPVVARLQPVPPTGPPLTDRPRWRTVLAAAGAVVVVAAAGWQVIYNVMPLAGGLGAPAPLARIANQLRFSQRWRMFAPSPGVNDGWFVIAGTLKDGREVDVFYDLGAPVTFEKPAHVADTYATARWRKFMMNNSELKRNGWWRTAHARWICTEWNAEHAGGDDGDELVSIKYNFMLERTVGRPTRPKKPEQHELLLHTCR